MEAGRGRHSEGVDLIKYRARIREISVNVSTKQSVHPDGANTYPSPLRPGRGGVRFTVAGPASDGPLTLVERGVTAF